jgi:hypothetical protein
MDGLQVHQMEDAVMVTLSVTRKKAIRRKATGGKQAASAEASDSASDSTPPQADTNGKHSESSGEPEETRSAAAESASSEAAGGSGRHSEHPPQSICANVRFPSHARLYTPETMCWSSTLCVRRSIAAQPDSLLHSAFVCFCGT